MPCVCAGVNNAFLIATHHSLARTYNDISVLENRHLAATFTLLHEQPEVNVLSGLDSSVWKQVRRIIIDAVLHTDMTYHFPTVAQVGRTNKHTENEAEKFLVVEAACCIADCFTFCVSPGTSVCLCHTI